MYDFETPRLSEFSVPDGIESFRTNFAIGNELPLNFTEESGIRYLGNPNNPYTVAIDVLETDGPIECLTFHEGTRVIGGFDYKLPAKVPFNATKLVFPSTLRTIGAAAFASTDVAELEFHSQLIEIEERAFYDCPNLTEVHIPYVEVIRRGAFENVGYKRNPFVSEGLARGFLRSFWVDAGLTRLEAYSLLPNHTTYVQDISLPNTLEHIDITWTTHISSTVNASQSGHIDLEVDFAAKHQGSVYFGNATNPYLVLIDYLGGEIHPDCRCVSVTWSDGERMNVPNGVQQVHIYRIDSVVLSETVKDVQINSGLEYLASPTNPHHCFNPGSGHKYPSTAIAEGTVVINSVSPLYGSSPKPLPSTVKYIGSTSFQFCRNDGRFVIPSSVELIEEFAILFTGAGWIEFEGMNPNLRLHPDWCSDGMCVI